MKHELIFIKILGTGLMIGALILAPLAGVGLSLGDADTLKATLTFEELVANPFAPGLSFHPLGTVSVSLFVSAGLLPFGDDVPDSAPLLICPHGITVLRC